jgi:hypothetical protein
MIMRTPAAGLAGPQGPNSRIPMIENKIASIEYPAMNALCRGFINQVIVAFQHALEKRKI